MKNFNLTELAFRHKEFVYFTIAMLFLAGIFSYRQLGRMEDPDFVIRQMVVSVVWPGASAREVEEQVTDKIEKKLQDTPGVDYLKSFSRPGQSIIYVILKESTPEKDVRPTWMEVRNMVNDIKASFPSGVLGPFFNDRFDDVFGSIYALTGDGFNYEDLRVHAETIRRTLLGIPNVKKVQLVGVQAEKIFIEMESSKLSQMGIDPNLLIAAIKTQNAMTASGMVETSSDNVYLRVSGMFESIDNVRKIPVRAAGRTFRLGDIATVTRGFVDPPDPMMFFNGKPAIGIALSMDKGGNILKLGEDLGKTIERIKTDLPLGLEIGQVSNQPDIVEDSIGEFIKSLLEAVVIVLIVSFVSLGLRSGIVVALCIPLVLAGVFACMKVAGIDLHKVSLGALIISLGLLVDDAIIAIEMMSVKLEQGWSRYDAACYAYTATALPMLTGTLITCAGFIPIGFAKGNAAEFSSSLFAVITMALLLSWVVSVIVTPLLGYKLIKLKPNHDPGHNAYDSKFYRGFRRILTSCLNQRKLVLIVTAACFVGSLFLFTMIRQEFFPPSLRKEIIVEMTLPEGSTVRATETQAARFAKEFDNDSDLASYSYHVGEGAPRFVLTSEPTLPNTNYVQFIFVAKDLASRNRLHEKANTILTEKFSEVRSHVKLLQTGPPSPYPVMLRVSGVDHEKTREIAQKVGTVMVSKPYLSDVNFDWNEKDKIMRLYVDQDKARMLGIDNQTLATSLQMQLSGAAIAEFRQEDKTVAIVFRMNPQDRKDLSRVKDLPIHIGGGKFVPLSQIAKISYDSEEGLIWRRNLKPTITVQAEIKNGITGNDATKKIVDELTALRESLPPGYRIDIGGSLENSAKSIGYLLQPVPVMILIIVFLLMLQLQRVSLMILTLLTAPLGVIGVTVLMLATFKPLGFVAELGILALGGMIIRNSVILIDQIEKHIADGLAPWDAIIDSAILRFRPIMLTAAAAILGMVPLIPSTFWGPMAIAIAGGLFGATILTLLVLPVMYATWFKIHPNTPAKTVE
ncbi:MAG: efflux RND transporter permease subunit [Negativicutes bacterium]